MNNEVLDIYNNLTDAEAESLFSTPKDSRKGDRRKIDYKKAKRKARIDLARSYDGLPLYDNLHSTAKTKFTVHVDSAVERIISDVISLPSKK